MPGIFSMIGQSWTFARKQPVLLHAGFWLLFLPMLIMSRLSAYLEFAEKEHNAQLVGPVILSSICIILLSIVVIWGTGCILLVGSRLLSAKSGRSRSSFSAVRAEARAFIVPLLLTNLLRGLITVLWGILLIVPGIIYALNTVFYSIIVVVEGIGYRQALRKSSALLKGKRLLAYWNIIALLFLLYAPASIVSGIIENFPGSATPILSDVMSNALYTVSTILFTLSTILLYQSLIPATKPVTGGGKKAVTKKVAAKKKK